MAEFILQNGRPGKDMEEGRLAKEIRSYDFLEHLEIPFVRIDHEPMATIEMCVGVDEALQVHICKNLFLCNRQETDFYLLLMPGDKKFLTRELSSQLGVARLSFAKESYMEEFLDITPGSVSVLGLMNDHEKKVRLLIDEDVLKEEYFACHPCINTSSIRFSTKDFTEKIIPQLGHEPTIVRLTGNTEG